ncbi:vitamin K epoxide reductase [Gordonia iterans]|uniref:Vitamin K epoxide reductase n=1 Tax=Gordonia iterans TaxID=1004901 RepID=A0A2S0KGE7_9ACTN|nr:vitamin K epoxide reductase family protein [Gordonia iterans]AVM00726.1 vitamin K epoxide reductase [Gordonia iterans]
MSDRATTNHRGLAVLLTAGGVIGLVAATALLVEKIALLKNPDYIPTCSINPVLSCGSVMTTPQAEAFGIPNPILGVAGFAVCATIGAALLAGADFYRWFWLGLQAGVTFAVVFVHWLIFQSLYRIGALCPYCMVVWAVTIPIFVGVTVTNLQPLAQRGRPYSRVIAVVIEYRSLIVTAWFALIIIAITVRFWDYWTSLV